MEYRLVFAPEMAVSTSEFVQVWEEDERTRAVAEARVVRDTSRAFGDPLLEVVELVLTTVAMGIATNALYDLVKKAVVDVMEKRAGQKASVEGRPRKHTKITQLDQPDGTHMLIIEQDEY
jgi:hypothetical protein